MSKGKIKNIILTSIFVIAAIVTIAGISLKDLWTNTNNGAIIGQHDTISTQFLTTKPTSAIETTGEQEQENQSQQYFADAIDTKNTSSSELEKYLITRKIPKSSAYVDNFTKIIVGVQDIDVFHKASLEITFSDNSTKIERVGAGKVFPFSKNGVKYQLIIIKVEYVYNYVEIQIEEK